MVGQVVSEKTSELRRETEELVMPRAERRAIRAEGTAHSRASGGRGLRMFEKEGKVCG